MRSSVPFPLLVISDVLLVLAFAWLFTVGRKLRSPAMKALRRGIVRFSQRDFDGAIADFSLAIELEPCPRHFYARAVAEQIKGETEAALHDYTRCIALDENFALAYGGRGLVKSRLGALGEAIADYTRSLDLDPRLADAYCNRGTAKYRLRDYEGAIADYSLALSIAPENATYYANRGTIRHTAGDLDGAIADYNHANQLNQTKEQHVWTEEIMPKL